jgi:hypothetical protein
MKPRQLRSGDGPICIGHVHAYQTDWSKELMVTLHLVHDRYCPEWCR